MDILNGIIFDKEGRHYKCYVCGCKTDSTKYKIISGINKNACMIVCSDCFLNMQETIKKQQFQAEYKPPEYL